MKVSGGFSLNANASDKSVIIAPELARLAEEASCMTGVDRRKQVQHHCLSEAVSLTRTERNIQQIKSAIEIFTNPFTEESTDLFNLVTKLVMTDKIKQDLCEQSDTGKKVMEQFTQERIQSDKVNICKGAWPPCVGPFPSVGLTLTWFIWDRNLALHITLYSVNSI